jgi:hypothetical protein
MTALLDKKRVLRIRLSQDEWSYLQKNFIIKISNNVFCIKIIKFAKLITIKK